MPDERPGERGPAGSPGSTRRGAAGAAGCAAGAGACAAAGAPGFCGSGGNLRHLRRRVGPRRQPDPRLRRWGRIALHRRPGAGGRCDGRPRRCRGALSRVGRRRHGPRSALATPIGSGGCRRRARLRHHGGRRLLPRWPRGGAVARPRVAVARQAGCPAQPRRHRDRPGQARRRHVRARRLGGKTADHGRIDLCDRRRHRPARHHRIARHDAHRAGDALVGVRGRTRGRASWRALRKQTRLR